MTLFNTSLPFIRARIVTRFPAIVQGADGITVDKEAGVYTIRPAVEQLAEVTSIPEAGFVTVWDEQSDVYSRIDASAFVGGGGGGAVNSVNGKTGTVVLEASDIAGVGDMAASTYDPDGVAADAFDMANMVEATDAKVMTAAERTKLSGVAAGATANSSDATLLARANHTGTQAISTVTNLQTTLDGKAGTAAVTTSVNGLMIAADKVKLNGIATAATANSSDATLLARANHTGTQSADTITDGDEHKVLTAAKSAKLDQIGLVKTITSDYTVTVADNGTILFVDASTGNITITLPSVADVAPFQIRIQRIGAPGNSITIIPDGSDEINDWTDYDLWAKFLSLSITTQGTTDWYVDFALPPPGSIYADLFSDGAVTNPKMASMPGGTIKGNNTGSTANAKDLTAAEATAMLEVFGSDAKGLVPASGGGTTKFLRADGTFAAPPGGGGGGGDMYASVYDPNAVADDAFDMDNMAEGTNTKIMTGAERTKLSGIATAATANSSDATLLARANHTGTQSADTLTDGTTNKAFLATERTKLSGIATGATANTGTVTSVSATVPTGLSISGSPITTSGTLVFTWTSGYQGYTSAEASKLAGIAASATANSSDATLLARANHTGTQAASTISDFATAADARISAAVGVSIQPYAATLAISAGGTGASSASAAFTALKQDATTSATGVVELATAAEFRALTAGKAIDTDAVSGGMAEVSLTDAATVAWNMGSGVDFTVTLAGNRTLGNPSATTVGKRGRIRVVQDGTGSRTLALASNLKTSGGAGITLSTAAGSVDYLDYDCRSSTDIRIALSKDWK